MQKAHNKLLHTDSANCHDFCGAKNTRRLATPVSKALGNQTIKVMEVENE